jgi:CDP-diacylglycerol--serine O-phosphatidyltransferase
MGNALCGILAIYFLYLFEPDITIGSSFIIIAMVFDGLDGLAARKFGTHHDYGKYLDSIADAISFGLAPAYLIFIIFRGSAQGSDLADAQLLIVSITAVTTAGCGIFRLIKFSFEESKYEFFSGLATPAFAFLIVIMAHILDPHRPENKYTLIPFFACAIILIGNILLVSNVRYPKIRGRTAFKVALGFIIGLLSLLIIKTMSNLDEQIIFIYYRTLSIFALIIIVTYVILGPIYLQLTSMTKSKKNK